LKKPFLIGLCCLSLFGCGKKADEPAREPEVKALVEVTVAKAHRETISQTISVTGTVTPLSDKESKVAPLAPGRIRSLHANVGDRVVKGQVLAQLDPGAVNGQVLQAEASVRSAEEALKQAHINFASQVVTQRSSVTQAEENLHSQQVALSKLVAGARPQEIAQSEAALASAQAALTNADQNLSRSQTLFGEGLLARKDLEAAQSQQASAASQVRTAQEALSLTRAGNRSQDIQAGRIAVQQAQEQLNAARSAALQNRSKAQDVRIAEQTLANARGALLAARAQLTGLTIRAPLSGTVTARTLNVGEWVDTSGSVASIADLSTVRILLQVPIGQIGKVHEGQTVEFTTESGPTRVRHATISVIGKAVDPATNTITIEAEAPNQDLVLKDDSFVRGTIVLAIHPDALVVPATALVQKDDKTVVFVVGADSVAHPKNVEIQLQQNGMAEVTGVSVGDQVVTSGAYELEDGTKVKTGS
jgi:HlyD family secretion protein